MNELPDHPDLPIKPPLILVASLVLGYLIDHYAPASARPAGWAGVGISLVAVSLLLGQWAMHQFRTQKTSVMPWKPTRLILDGGPFRFTRNPIYLSFVLLQLGVGVWHDRLAVLLMALPSALALDVLVIRREEAYLTRKFGADYLDYRSRVRRWL